MSDLLLTVPGWCLQISVFTVCGKRILGCVIRVRTLFGRFLLVAVKIRFERCRRSGWDFNVIQLDGFCGRCRYGF